MTAAVDRVSEIKRDHLRRRKQNMTTALSLCGQQTHIVIENSTCGNFAADATVWIISYTYVRRTLR